MSANGTYKVHRLRFGDWKPAGIKTIAVDAYSNIVAIGRTDGSIEIHDSVNKWYVLVRGAIGRDDFQLQSLKYAAHAEERHRLFGISLRGFVFELDLASLTMKNIRDSYGGNVWCMAMSPRDAYFSVGCEDGTHGTRKGR